MEPREKTIQEIINDINNEDTSFNNDSATEADLPKKYPNQLKTPHSNNITVEEWNLNYKLLKHVTAEHKSLVIYSKALAQNIIDSLHATDLENYVPYFIFDREMDKERQQRTDADAQLDKRSKERDTILDTKIGMSGTSYSDFTYEYTFRNLDYAYGKKWVEKFFHPESFGLCSVIRKGNIIARSLDWSYDYNASIVVRTPHTKDFYSTLGVTSACNTFDYKKMAGGVNAEDFKALPFIIIEGFNEKGLHVAVNLVIRENNHTTGTIPTEVKWDEVCMNMLPRYILDRYATVAETIENLTKYVSIHANTIPVISDYELHFLISDATGASVALEFINNEIKTTPTNILTNFYLYGTTPNEDGSFYTVEDYNVDNAHDPITVNGIQKYAMGIERYNLLNNILKNIPEEEVYTEFVKELDYRRIYSTFSHPSFPFWYTDYCVKYDSEEVHYDLNVNSPLDDFRPLINSEGEQFIHLLNDE